MIVVVAVGKIEPLSFLQMYLLRVVVLLQVPVVLMWILLSTVASHTHTATAANALPTPADPVAGAPGGPTTPVPLPEAAPSRASGTTASPSPTRAAASSAATPSPSQVRRRRQLPTPGVVRRSTDVETRAAAALDRLTLGRGDRLRRASTDAPPPLPGTRFAAGDGSRSAAAALQRLTSPRHVNDDEEDGDGQGTVSGCAVIM